MNFISKANLHSAFALTLLFMCFGVAQAQVPNEPTIFATLPINTGGAIAFAPPSDIGGSSITNYQYSIDNDTNWNTPNSVTFNPDGTGLLVIGSGLTNCTSYTIKLRAVNASGSGMASASASLTPRASIIGFNWINASVYGQQHNWTSVTHGNGLFVAVSNSAELNSGIGDRVVMTSTNGFNWSSSNSAPDNDWTSATYGNGLFVAVANSGTGNRVMTSPNGNGYTWTSRTSAADNNWSSVTYGNGLFVAVANSGTGNRVMTSPNGITWTSRTSAVDNGWHSVTYGNGLFVAVANSGTGNRVMTSPDGITWTSRTPAADNNWNSVTYGDAPLGLFVAVSDNGTGNRVMTSPDGITWTSRTSSASNWSNVAYGNGQFVAVSNLGGSEQVMASVINVAIAADAPVISDATFGTSATTVNFTQSSLPQAPIPAITNYEYSTNNGINWAAVSPAATTSPLSISNLPSGANQIMIRAVNNAGNSCPSNNYRKICTPTSSSETQSACSSYVWNGTTYTTSGAKTWTGTNAAGCDSVVTLNLTITASVSNTTTAAACGSYTWSVNSQTYTSSGSYTVVSGCSTEILNLTINQSVRGDTLYEDVCTSNPVFSWNGIDVTANCRTIVTSHHTAASGCDSISTLVLTVSPTKPATPSSITQTLVSNVCGAKVYRYAASAVSAAFGYAWTLPTSVGGVAGVILDSGDINRSRVIKVRYVSNEGAIAGDSIKVRAWTGCGFSGVRAVKLVNTTLYPPVAPTLTITLLDSRACGKRTYRYTMPALPSRTSTSAAATGYIWSFVGSLGQNAQIDSGTLTSRIIVVRYTSNAAAQVGDSVKGCYSSDCGISAYGKLKLPNLKITVPQAPVSITSTLLLNDCGNRVYRYTMPLVRDAIDAVSTGGVITAAGNGYLWSFTGSLGQNAQLDSGTLTSRIIVVRYTSNAAAQAGDSIRAQYNSDCGFSAIKAIKLTNLIKNGCPVSPASTNRGTASNVSSQLEVYPNPSDKEFNVVFHSAKSERVTYKIVDLQGKLVSQLYSTPNENIQVGSGLSSGVYMLEARQGKEVRVQKLIKY